MDAARPRRLAIVAGDGPLPNKLVSACRAQGIDTFVVGLEGQASPEWSRANAQRVLRLGQGGRLLRLMKEQGADAIVFVGKVHRPSLRAIRPDWTTAQILMRLAFQGRLGDDAITGAVVKRFERDGFRVMAVQELLGTVDAVGPLGRRRPTPEEARDIELGVEAARTVGRLDIGHAVVVQGGAVLAVEAAEGTDALIRRASALQRGGPGAVLVKMAKPQQDARADPPTLGLATVECAAAAGFGGIAFETERSLVVDLPAMTKAADAANMFLVGLAPDGG
ncbi:MAG: LpxI family protein [Dongiaceae bacterium]